jgi:hypothetical protein
MDIYNSSNNRLVYDFGYRGPVDRVYCIHLARRTGRRKVARHYIHLIQPMKINAMHLLDGRLFLKERRQLKWWIAQLVLQRCGVTVEIREYIGTFIKDL